MDNQFTKLEDRLKAAKPHILLDKKIYKRLRYNMALFKINQAPTVKQADLLSQSILPYLERQGISTEDFETYENEIQTFLKELMAEAWADGDIVENFKVLKVVRENTKG